MDAKLLAKVALRVLAVFMVATAIMELPQLATINYRPDASEFLLLITVVFMLGAPLLIGVALWTLAPRVAGWAVGKAEAGHAAEPADAGNIQTIAFVTVGLVLAIQAGATLLGVAYAVFTSPELSGAFAHSYQLPAQVAKLVLGLVFMFGARFFTQLFRRFREFGMKADT